MKKVLNFWKTGWIYLLSDECMLSYYTYFTIIFAEIVYLFLYKSRIAIPFTILFALGIANICICPIIKLKYEGSKIELITSIIYVLVFVITFIIGCFINLKASIILLPLPWIVTAIYFWFVDFFYELFPLFTGTIIFSPYVIFALLLFKTTIDSNLVILILALYFIIMPLLGQLEEFLCGSIFETAYEMSYIPSNNYKR